MKGIARILGFLIITSPPMGTNMQGLPARLQE